MRTPRRLLVTLAVMPGWLLVAACGSSGGSPATRSAPTDSIPTASVAASAAQLLNWTEFGLNPRRSDVTESPTGITAGNVAHLARTTVQLPGTVDSSPIYLHGVTVAGVQRDAIVVTTTYGRTLAIDAASGRILWTFTPSGYGSWAGSYQITTASPLADPGRGSVYATSPDGLVHKLLLASGSEQRGGGWPARVTLEPRREKLAAALNIDGPYLLVATGGYIGDTPPYQGHLVVLERSSGRRVAIFNTLCAGRRYLQVPSSCPASDSAILSRAGAVVEPGGRRVLLDTGNAPWNGTTDFGDSVIELTLPHLRLRQYFTPTNQEELNRTDTDLGSSGPVLLGHDRVMVSGKDGVMRVLVLSRLNGHAPGGRPRTGGEAQRLPLPGGGELFTAPAVWSHGGHTTMFVADEHATAAYVLRSGRLTQMWRTDTPGTSPILAGGLLYVYEPDQGGIEVYRPGSPRPIAHLPGSSGHWNSPIVVDGHVVEPEGDANDHLLSGSLEIFSAG
ncbi:MAG TPA: PQQ-binding-like beta-propeller repeat protein [Solirubrobacteraceae bacterium]|nr:PQQ-binding-like beta-propeller repeat protein [Solirubrobacteraceae bacterium]